MDNKVRIFTRNPLIPLAVILFGAVWFALSIFSFFVGLLIPWAILRMPPAARRRRRGNNPASSVAAVSEPVMSNSGNQPIQHRVTFPDTPPDATPRPRTAKRWSSPSGVPLDADSSKYRQSTYAIVLDSTTTLVDESSSHRFSPELPKSDSPAASFAGLKGDDPFADSPVSCSRRGSLSSSNRKLPLAARFTGMKVFRSRSLKRGRDPLSRSDSMASSCSSTRRSLTPPPPSPPKRDDDPKADRGESSSRGEAFRSAISAPFKFKPKRASASATMSTAYMEKVSLYAATTTVEAPATEPITQTPSPPPSPSDEFSASAVTPTTRTRRKPFTAYLNLSLSTEVATSITSPRRRSSVSSSSTNSGPSIAQQPRILSILSPTASAGFKSPKTPRTPVPVARTQPYGAPYFAKMPTGEYAYDEKYRRDYAKRNNARKVSGSASDVPRSAGVRKFSRDDGEEERVSPRTARPPSNASRASSREPQAQVASRRRRGSGHRRNISDGVMTS